MTPNKINELRPCLIVTKPNSSPIRMSWRYSQPKKALFHKWIEERRLIVASPYVHDGHDSGVVSELLAIVELENGEIWKIEPEQIRFLDSPQKFEEQEAAFI